MEIYTQIDRRILEGFVRIRNAFRGYNYNTLMMIVIKVIMIVIIVIQLC